MIVMMMMMRFCTFTISKANRKVCKRDMHCVCVCVHVYWYVQCMHSGTYGVCIVVRTVHA